MNILRKIPTSLILASGITLAAPGFTLDFSQIPHGYAVFELGGYIASEGKPQNIAIQDMVGNTYTTSNGNNGNLMVGAGYLFNGPQNKFFNNKFYNLDYGLNLFYLAPSIVKGNVLQEQTFNNFTYSYKVTNIPIYALTKFTIKTKSERYHLTVDAGVGPNFVITSNYQETPLASGYVPDNAFTGHTKTTLSAMIGVGLKIDHVFGSTPLECGYRFFYLGQGYANKNINQLQDNLETSNGYAHAVTCSVSV